MRRATTPEGAEILSLRHALRLALDERVLIERALTSEWNAATSAWARLRGKLKAARMEIVVLQARVRDLEDEARVGRSDAENDVRISESSASSARAERDAARREVEALKKAKAENDERFITERDQAREKVKTLENEIENRKADEAQLRDQITKLSKPASLSEEGARFELHRVLLNGASKPLSWWKSEVKRIRDQLVGEASLPEAS